MGALLVGVLPVFVLIALGCGLRKSDFLPDATWRPIEKLTVNILYPAFLVPAVWNADLAGASASAAAISAVLAVLIVAAATFAARPFLSVDGPGFTSVLQGTIRWNSFVFIPVIQSVFGEAGLGLAAVMIAAIIPVTNTLCVVALAKWGEGQAGLSPLTVTRAILTNPILVACIVGLILNVTGAPPVPGITELLALLGGASLPLGLIVAGAGLSFAAVARRRWTVAGVTFVKLILMPPLMWGLCRLLGGDETAQAIALLCGAAPGAAASYLLARQMGGDAPLMAGIVASTTVGSAVTIPVLLAVFHLA